MSRSDRLSNLITKWQERERSLREIRDFFAKAGNRSCVEICDFGLQMIGQCLAEYQRANYPLDPPDAHPGSCQGEKR